MFKKEVCYMGNENLCNENKDKEDDKEIYDYEEGDDDDEDYDDYNDGEWDEEDS